MAKPKAEGKTTKSGIVVNDPLVLVPKELPLVIELPKEANKAQQEYAKVLNAYAYKNPAKWAVKKDQLISQLEQLGKNPGLLDRLIGKQNGPGDVSISSKAPAPTTGEEASDE